MLCSLLVSFRAFTSQQASAQLPHIFALLRAALLRQLDEALEAARAVGGACVPTLPAEQVRAWAGVGLAGAGLNLRAADRGGLVLGFCSRRDGHTSQPDRSIPLPVRPPHPPLPSQRDAYIRHVSSTEGLAALAAAVVRNASSVLKVWRGGCWAVRQGPAGGQGCCQGCSVGTRLQVSRTQAPRSPTCR